MSITDEWCNSDIRHSSNPRSSTSISDAYPHCPLPTPALSDNHAIVFVFIGDRAVFVYVQQRYGFESCGNAADGCHFLWVGSMKKALDHGVLGRSESLAHRKVTLTRALVRLYRKRSQNYIALSRWFLQRQGERINKGRHLGGRGTSDLEVETFLNNEKGIKGH